MSIFLKKYFILSVLIFLIIFDVFAQKNSEFQKKREKIRKNIEFTNKILNETNKDADKSITRLKLINKKIYNREVILNNLNREIRHMTDQIDQKGDSIHIFEKQLNKLLKEYEKMVIYAYKNKTNYDKMMFIFSAQDFNQAYKRLIYLKQYVSFRKRQVELIQSTRKKLEAETNQLLENKKHKQELLNIRTKENSKLLKERQQQSRIVRHLKRKIDDLEVQLENQRKISVILDHSVSKTITEDTESKKTSKEEAKRTHKIKSDDLAFDPNGFAKYKGKLPWPLKHGVILNYFGEHPHSFLKGVKIFNNGIDISTIKGSFAKAVYDGKVSKIVNIPGANKAVLLCHGNYYTLYSNLETVDVKVGDKLKTNEKIGKVYTDINDNNITLLQFQIWHLNHKLNPSDWLSRQ